MIGKRWIIGYWIAVMGGCLMACAPQAVREAEDVVAQADSLWHEGKQYGIDEGDSATLAQAYKTLEAIPLPFREGLGLGSPYAHACYHYGKLLRAKENPVEAMQAFIAATHSGTKDYHILGRIYSNIGSICHLAGEFQLSYNMYEKSADMFIRNGDTLAFYYAHNDMAFELAEQGKKEETLSHLALIENQCHDDYLLTKIWETKANAYLYNQQYDSAIYCAQYVYYTPTTLIICAQAYSNLGIGDSATYYAEKVLNASSSLGDINNALYILTNDDKTKDTDAIREIAASRSDTQKLLEIRQGRLSQAVQLLEQDLHYKPDYRWLYAILATLVVVGACIYAYIHRKRRQHALLSQQVNDLDIQNKEAETQHEKIIGDIEKHKRTITDEIEKNCQLIIKAESFPQNIYWNKYKKMCSIVDKRFYMLASKLHTKYKLNETETRLCVLTLLDCKYDLIADLLYRSNSSIGTLKIRVAKKLGTTAKDLRMYLIENECVN